jgi:transmembrane protein EpsG
MLVYYLLIALWGAIYISTSKIDDARKNFLHSALFGFTMFLVMGLRDRSVGVDISQYLDLFDNNRYLFYGSYNKLEYGFHAYMRIMSFLGLKGQSFILITSLIISVSFARFFYKYSANVGLSFYLHLTIGLFIVTLSALRQSIAICLILFAIDYILERKPVKFLIVVYLASTFHFSAIVFLPVYFCTKINMVSYHRLFIILLSLFSLLFLKEMLMSFVQNFIPEQYMAHYGALSDKARMNFLLVLISLAIPLFIVLLWKFTDQKANLISNEESFFFVLTCICTVITIFALNFIMISRISFYFIPAYIVLIPNALSRVKLASNKLLLFGSIILVSFIYFIMAAVGNVLEIDNYHLFF